MCEVSPTINIVLCSQRLRGNITEDPRFDLSLADSLTKLWTLLNRPALTLTHQILTRFSPDPPESQFFYYFFIYYIVICDTYQTRTGWYYLEFA